MNKTLLSGNLISMNVPRNMYSLLTIMFLASYVPRAGAVLLGATCARPGLLHAYEDLLHKTAVIGKEDRKPITSVAKDLKLSPEEVAYIRKSVGYISCPGTKSHNPATATGFLIGSDQKLMTVAHIFKDEKTGKFREPLSDCFFQNQEVPPKKIKLEIGADGAGLTAGSPGMDVQGMDFAMAKLAHPVDGAKPLKLEDKEHELAVGDKIIVVSAFQHGIKRADPSQPVAQSCDVRDVGYYRSIRIYTSCDGAGGASGSPVFTRDSDGHLIVRGLITGVGPHTHDGDEYKFGDNYTSGIGFDGKPFKMLYKFISD